MRRLAAILVLGAVPATAQDDGRYTSFALMSPELQQMQTDDMANPGMLLVAQGEELWNTPRGAAEAACADCHQAEEMEGVAARYPAYDEQSEAPVDLQGRVRLCQARHQEAEPSAYESEELLAWTAFVANKSRGMPIAPPEDPRLTPYRARGEELFTTRMGQLNLSCATCHDDLDGSNLAAATIPQAHPTGYPQYRLQWQEVGSVQRRLRNCMTGIRAEPFAFGSDEHVALELYLAERAAGLEIETPAVRP